MLFAVCGLFAHTQAYIDDTETHAWYFLEHAKISMERGEFGSALMFTDKARNAHRKQMQDWYAELSHVRTITAVRDAGDSISAVYAVLEKRENLDACAVFDEIFASLSSERFSNSMKQLLQYVHDNQLMPEADYLTGKIYDAEGEYEQAIFYYNRSLENSAFLTIPDERFFILYALADIHNRLGKKDLYEKYLLLILSEDPLFGTTAMPSKTRQAMVRTVKKAASVEKFFTLYRYNKPLVLKAYADLMQYYLEEKEPERALAVGVVAVDIALTMLDNALKNANFSYRYRSLPDLFERIASKPHILQQASVHTMWDVFLNFADVLYAAGLSDQARDLYITLAQNLPVFEYARIAAAKLSDTL